MKPWFRVALPKTTGRRSDHRSAAPWWEGMCQALLKGEPETGLLGDPLRREPDLDQTETMLVAYLARWTALGGGAGLSFKISLDDVLELLKDRISERVVSKGLTFEEAVNRKTRELRVTASRPNGELPSSHVFCTAGMPNPTSGARRGVP